MDKLLECTDLRNNKRVIEAYWALMGGCWKHKRYGQYQAIPGSLADVAFEMMDACIEREIGNFTCLNTPTAEEIIITATLAWEAAK